MKFNLKCDENPNEIKFILGLFIVFGLLVSWTPQLTTICKKKSSFGLSIYYLLLAFLGSAGTISNVILLQSGSIYCCFNRWSRWYCIQNTLGITQVVVQCICFLTVVVLYYKYFPTVTSDEVEPLLSDQNEVLNNNDDSDVNIENRSQDDHLLQMNAESRSQDDHLLRMNIENRSQDDHLLQMNAENTKIKYFMLLVGMLTILLVVYLLLFDDMLGDLTLFCAGFLGFFAAITGTLQFVPQIIHTVRERDFGALSVYTLLMQCPGSFVFAYSLFLQPGTNWTTWISYVVCGTLQGILVILYFIFKFTKNDLAEPN